MCFIVVASGLNISKYVCTETSKVLYILLSSSSPYYTYCGLVSLTDYSLYFVCRLYREMRGDSQVHLTIAATSYPLFANNSIYTRPQVCS